MQKLKLTKTYETYPEYKDSGVEWLGEIPKGWEITRSKFLFQQRKTRALPNDEQLTASQEFGVIPQKEFMERNGHKVVQVITGADILKHVEPNDFVISMRSFQGGIEFSRYKGAVSSAYVPLVPSEKVVPEYFSYLLKSKSYINALQLTSNLVRDGQALRFENFSMVDLLIVPKLEQSVMATYLDKKTALIDKIIEKKKKQIELLREKRTAVINHAVTSTEWKSEKLKYVAPERKIKLEKMLSALPYIGLEHIESGTGKRISASEEVVPESSVNFFCAGDVLFGKLRPYLAKVFTPEFSGACSGEFLVLAPRAEKMSNEYLFYKLLSRDFIKKVDDSTYGAKMPRANWQSIGNIPIEYPQIEQQKIITEKLDKDIEAHSSVIRKIEKSITLLQEFKSSLISHVVTGKVKIGEKI